MLPDSDQQHFKLFAQTLKSSNEKKYPTPKLKKKEAEKALLAKQKVQVEKLVELEDAFRKLLLEHPNGIATYDKFIAYICDHRKNILDARPYFRERQSTFTSKISQSFKDRDSETLSQFHGNWQFISFCLKNNTFRKNSQLYKIAHQIEATRTELAEMNLPLAISRARIFYSKTPKSHLSHMDLVQIASEGLLSGIDKFCLPFSKMFRGVCVGRIVGNFISNYNDTMLHFYPGDKRTLYRANKAAARMPNKTADLDYEALAAKVNEDSSGGFPKTTASEVARLMSAASCVSGDDSEGGESPKDSGMSRAAAPDGWRPDVRLEQAELALKMGKAINRLPLLHQKVLRLRGVDYSL